MTKKVLGMAAIVWLLCLVSPGQAGWCREPFSGDWGNVLAFISAVKPMVVRAWSAPASMQSSCPGGSCRRTSALRRFWSRLRRASKQEERLQQEAEKERQRLEQPHPDATAAGELPEALRYEQRGGWYYVIERETGREVFRIKAGARPGERRFGTMSWLDRWMYRNRLKKERSTRHPWRWERRKDGTYHFYDSVTGEFQGTFKLHNE
ncbi:MAG TPA: hypothetical protein PLE92_10530 [Lentisphaeria bacterium]|nr:hypothetical protein [Lentisphaeria bacterium]